MSENQKKLGTGALFQNDYKTKDTQPGMKGSLTGLDGQEYKVAAWKRQTKDGKSYLSLVIEASQPQPQPSEPGVEPVSEGHNDIDDLPF